MIPRTEKGVLRYLGKLADAATDSKTGLLFKHVAKQKNGQTSVAATGYFISTCYYYRKLFDMKDFQKLAQRFADPLKTSLFLNAGAADGATVYLFDTQVALAAFWQLCVQSGKTSDWKLYFDISDRSREMIRDFIATGGDAAPDDWTAQMGAHLLRFHANLPHEESEILHRLTALPSMRRFMDGLEPETPLPTRQALHGLEGLLLVPTVQHWQLLNAAMLLGRHQNGDGGVWAYLSTDAKDTVAVDATAQAVRVWSIVDAKRFYGEIKKALGYLDDQFEDAGLKDPTDGKRATHASLFALQAASFAERGGNPSELI